MSHPVPADPSEAAPLTPPWTVDERRDTRGRPPARRRGGGGPSSSTPNRDRPTEPAAAVSTTDELLRVLIAVTGRVAIPEARLRVLVGRNPRTGDKYMAAYDLCDGSRGVSEIARLSGLDHGNLSRTITRWVDQGVMFKLGWDARSVQLYRLSAGGREDDGIAATDESPQSDGSTASPVAPATRPPRRPRDARNSASAAPSADGTRAEGDVRPPREAESLELPLDNGGLDGPGR